MEKKFDDFSMQEAKRLANTPTGQQLISLMKQTDPEAVQKALAQAAAGDLSQIQQTLAPLMASPEVKALLKKMGG